MKRIPALIVGIMLSALVLLVSCTSMSNSVSSSTAKAYEKDLYGRMEIVWQRLASARIDTMAVGRVKIAFDIDATGHVEALTITSNPRSKVLAGVAARTVRETRILPIPQSMLATLPSRRMHFELDFVILPGST